MIPDELQQLFVEEATDLLRDFEEGVLELEQASDSVEALNRVFRAAHTLKGASGMLGFTDIARFTHFLETLLLRLRKRELTVSTGVVEYLLRASDLLRRLVDGAREGRAVPADDVADMEAAGRVYTRDGNPPDAPRAAPPPAAPAVAEAARGTLYVVRFHPPDDLLLRGLDPLRLLDALESVGTLLEVEVDTSRLPALADMDPERTYFGFTCRLVTARPVASIEACFDVVGGRETVTIEPAAAGDSSLAGRGVPAARGSRPSREPGAPIRAEAATFRVSAAKVDRLVNLVGEIAVTQSMVEQVVTAATPDRLIRLEGLITEMRRHCRELEERVMAIRMVPIQTVFGRFPRLIRDLAAALGKDVWLETSGDDTELDRSMIEQITDPLTHLVRNAVDHGIEPPDVRQQAGKGPSGCVTLAAYQRSGSIYIEVADDGRGLERDRILAKAWETGLIAAGASPADEDVFALIFQPGFSTAAAVTEISGRGVGLDVVNRNIRRLGGAISIQSVPGQGTRFTVRLPLTLASLDGQTLRVGPETYVLPLGSIVESLRPRRDNFRTVLGDAESLMLRGEVLPVLRLHRVFGVTPAVDDPLRSLAVIVEHEGRRLALLVDELLEQQQVVIKSLDTNFHAVDGVGGATILGDGRVALILDVAGLIALGRMRQAPRPVLHGADR
jgi:two-component system chemotaxis sensor kinase CheA